MTIQFTFMNYDEWQTEIDRALGEDQTPQIGDIESSFGVKNLLTYCDSNREKFFVTEHTTCEDAYQDLNHPIAGFIVHTDTAGNVSNEEFTNPDELRRAWDSYEHEAALLEDVGEDGDDWEGDSL